MTIEELQRTVVSALQDIKGQNIMVFDAQPLTSLFDRVVIVSGTSNRQTRALAKHLHDKVKQAGGGVYGTEGEETGEWILVDLGDAIVHIMQPTIREYYRLEEIWGKHPIDWEAALKKSSKPAPRRKPTARKPITGTLAEKTKAVPATKTNTAAKTTGKTTAKKTTKPAAKPAAKKSIGKKPATKKPAAKKSKK